MTNTNFTYNYKAPTQQERKEVENIKKQYINTNSKDDNLTKLRRLNNKAIVFPNTIALTSGVIALLIFGLGLTCILEWSSYIFGLPLLILSSIGMAIIPFIHKKCLYKSKEKYKNQIIELCNQILNENGDSNAQ